jgi:hypothetical protein
MALINPMIFSKEGAGDGLPLHYAARFSERLALENTTAKSIRDEL